MKSAIRLKLWQQIALVVFAGVCPMVLITLGVITVSINKDIDFGKLESCGVEYQRPLEELLDAIPRYREACRAAAYDGKGTSDVAAISGKIDDAFARLALIQNKYGEELQFTRDGLASRKREAAAPEALLASWNAIKKAPEKTVADGEAASRLVTDIRTAITHVGDTSNLILDPDLDSYYLMDITLCAMPQTQERLGDIAFELRPLIVDGTIAERASDIAVYAAMLSESDIGRIVGDSQTVLNEDANFYGVCESLQRNLPQAVDNYSSADNDLVSLLSAIKDGKTTSSPEEFDKKIWSASSQAYETWKKSADELAHLLEIRIDAYRTRRTISFLLIALAIAFSTIVSWLFIRRLDRTIKNVAAGLQLNAGELNGIAAQFEKSGHSLAESSSEQASSIAETSASIEELSGMSQSNADTAREMTEIVKEARDTAEKSDTDIRELSKAMNNLESSSGDIAKIVRTIDEIAFQTNILALNAAVEAARAGESGAGFAVVADEVRQLAMRSASAAKETSSQIENAIALAGEGVKISANVENKLRDISERIRRIDESARSVATASKEQSQGIGQISEAMGQMDSVTQNNAAGAEENAASAADLTHQIGELERSVGELTALVGGR